QVARPSVDAASPQEPDAEGVAADASLDSGPGGVVCDGGSSMTPAASTVYYVAKTGNDAHSCEDARSPDTPMLTINVGITCLRPGSRLEIKAGVYEEAIPEGAIPSGTSTGYVTITRFGCDQVRIRPNGTNRVVEFSGTQSYIELSGLILDGTYILYD